MLRVRLFLLRSWSLQARTPLEWGSSILAAFRLVSFMAVLATGEIQHEMMLAAP